MEPLSGLASKKVGKVLVSAYVSLGVQEYHFPGYLIIRLTMMTDVKCLQLGEKGLVNEGMAVGKQELWPVPHHRLFLVGLSVPCSYPGKRS